VNKTLFPKDIINYNNVFYNWFFFCVTNDLWKEWNDGFLHDRSRQLKIRIGYYDSLKELQMFLSHHLPCKDLSLKGFSSRFSKKIISQLSQVSSLRLLECKDGFQLALFNALFTNGSRITQLMLYDFPDLTDCLPFSHVQSVELKECPSIRDVNCLKDCSKIIIRGCHSIVEVNGLGRVPYLSIVNCEYMQDLSALTDNVVLILAKLPRLKYVPFMTNIQHLQADWILKAKDLLGLEFEKLKTLTLHSFRSSELPTLPSLGRVELKHSQIQLLSSLANTYEVKLTNCRNIVDLKGLEKVPIIYIEDCNRLKDISALAPCPTTARHYHLKVTIKDCKAIEDYFPLKFIPNVTVYHHMNDGHAVQCTKHLFLAYCPLTDLTMLGQLEYLHLMDCNKIRDFQGIGDIPVIKIQSCKSLHRVKGLEEGKNEKLILEKECSLVRSRVLKDLYKLEEDSAVYLGFLRKR
jgi:hypothetical protein